MATDDRTFEKEDPKPRWKYEVKPREYATPGRKAPPIASKHGPSRSVVRIERADRRLDEPRPDPQASDITGRYQSSGAMGEAGQPSFLLHVNQAGRHLEGLLVQLPRGRGNPASMQRFEGESKGADAFTVLVYRYDDEIRGEIRVEGECLVLTLPLWHGLSGTTFHLREPRATFLDGALDAVTETQEAVVGPDKGIKAMVESAESCPLTDSQMFRLERAFAANQIGHFLDTHYALSSRDSLIDRSQRLNATENLDKYVGKAFDDAGCSRQQQALAVEYVRTILVNHRATINDSTRSQLEWVEDMAAEAIVTADALVQPTATNIDKGKPRELANLRLLLGITAPLGTGAVYEYEIVVNLEAKDTPLKGLTAAHARAYYGAIEVTKLEPGRWKQGYSVVLLGGGVLVGKGGSDSIDAKGTFSARGHWTQADFPGWVVLHDGGAWAAKKVPVSDQTLGLGNREPALVLIGRGNHPRQIVSLKGANAVREGLGAEYALAWGRIFDLAQDLSKLDYGRVPRRIERLWARKLAESVHFDFGSALLKGIGRAQVRIFCAVWLRWLGSPYSSMCIVGHADTVDTKERNLELSTMRAKNVLQAIRDILGKKLAIPESAITVKGMGETEADEEKTARELAAGRSLPDTPNRLFRRVEVELDGRCVLVLWGA